MFVDQRFLPDFKLIMKESFENNSNLDMTSHQLRA